MSPVMASRTSSVTTTSRATEGPALVTVRVQVTSCPGTGVPGVMVLVMDTSACGSAVPVVEEELLPGVVSVGEATVAVLSRSPV